MIKSINNIPYQYKGLPKGLIFNVPNTHLYNLVDTKSGNKIGKMHTFVQKDHHLFYKKVPYLDVLYIEDFEIEKSQRGKGWGKYFIDFVKNLSFVKKCEGRTTLVAYDPDNSPHLFYRKLDFASNYENFNDEMDKYIKENRRIENCWDAVPMYLPEDKIQRNLHTIL